MGADWARLSANRQICLASHASLDRLYWLVDTVQVWSGPISVALYISQAHSGMVGTYLRYLRRCHPGIRKQVGEVKSTQLAARFESPIARR